MLHLYCKKQCTLCCAAESNALRTPSGGTCRDLTHRASCCKKMRRSTLACAHTFSSFSAKTTCPPFIARCSRVLWRLQQTLRSKLRMAALRKQMLTWCNWRTSSSQTWCWRCAPAFHCQLMSVQAGLQNVDSVRCQARADATPTCGMHVLCIVEVVRIHRLLWRYFGAHYMQMWQMTRLKQENVASELCRFSLRPSIALTSMPLRTRLITLARCVA